MDCLLLPPHVRAEVAAMRGKCLDLNGLRAVPVAQRSTMPTPITIGEVQAGWQCLRRGYGRNAVFYPVPALTMRRIDDRRACHATMMLGTHLWIEGETAEIDLRDRPGATARLSGYAWLNQATS